MNPDPSFQEKADPVPNPDPGFDDQKFKKKIQLKIV
jgi:hypothetical protein